MHIGFKLLLTAFSVFIAVFFQACASKPIHLPDKQLAVYISEDKNGLINQHMPLFIIENYQTEYNRIGTVSAKLGSLDEVIYINTNKATVYTQKREFTTSTSTYTNLIYRVHFQHIPKQYLSYGKNVGLFVIVTLDENSKPLLYTTVHTCGCYLAFIPTSNLNKDAYPNDWTKNLQYIYGESLPTFIDIKKGYDTAFLLRGDTHRVKDVLNITKEDQKRFYKIRLYEKQLISLENIYLNKNETLSFFVKEGERKDYVKNSFKPWEKLYMSWWVFDSYVGEDKRLGHDKTDGVSFYTSLKPWARDESDMRDFATFLKYWGWKL